MLLLVIHYSQGNVTIENSIIHESEPIDKSEDSPLLSEEETVSSEEPQQVKPTPNPEVIFYTVIMCTCVHTIYLYMKGCMH